MNRERVELTADEWMSLIDGTRDDPQSLQKCCANISDLRDHIIGIARDGGELLWKAKGLLRSYLACANGHDMGDIPALRKIVDACLAQEGMTHEQLLAMEHADREHPE